MPGGANWNNPTTTRLYNTQILPDIKTRDEDAITLLGGTAPTNLPVGAIKYNRANFELQEWDGAAFNAVKFAVTSGGTGATTASGARTNLGIGTLGTQNSNAVSITGGTISGISSLVVNGGAQIFGKIFGQDTSDESLFISGGIRAGSGLVRVVGTDGRIPAINSTYFADLSGVSSAIPSGLIAMFDTACPAGWTRFSALDNKFPSGAATYGTTGGATTHSHTVTSHSHTLPANTGSTSVAHTHSGTTNADAAGTLVTGAGIVDVAFKNHTHTFSTGGMSANDPHTHTIGGSTGAASPTTDAISHIPPFLSMVFCRKN